MSELLRILLVDDHPGRDREIESVLRGLPGVECLVADSLEQGRTGLLEDSPDAVLVRWPWIGPDLPAAGGIREWASQKPVLLLLAEDDPAECARAIRAGVQDCLPERGLGGEGLLRSIVLAIHRQRERDLLRLSERRYRSLFERNLTGVYRCTPDGRIVDANLALARMLGVETVEELKQHAASEFYPNPEERTAAMARLFDLMAVTDAELCLQRLDGSLIWVLESMTVLDGGTGGIPLIEGTLVDITRRKHLEEALAYEQGLLYALMEHLPDSIYFKDTESRFIRISHACARKFNCRDASEAVGKTDFDFFAPVHAAKAFADEQLVMRTGTPMIGQEEREDWPDGQVAWASTTKLPMYDARGNVVGTFGVSRDITRLKLDRARIEQLQRQNELILNSVGEGIYGVDQDGVVTFANPAASVLTGWPQPALIGKPLHDLLHPPTGMSCAGRECALRQALTDHDRHQQEEVFVRRDGSSFSVEFIANALVDEKGDLAGAVLAFRDISERREIERMKDEFVSVVSHELRTPLTSIRGALGLLVSGRLGELPERGRHMLEIAASNTDRLVRLINDILDLERIESGKIRMECDFHDLSELVRQALEMMAPIAERTGIQLQAKSGRLMAWVDADRLQQTIGNLLSNAIKFSPPDSVVTVETGEAEGGVFIRVRDQGRGIPAEQLEQIFERFHQVDKSDSRDKGGTGLGLPICRRIVEQHGGRIWAESRMGEGSTFHISLPRNPPEPVLAKTSRVLEKAVAESSVPVMLVYSEDFERRERMARQMEEAGYRVLKADSPEDAIKQSESERLGALLVDPPASAEAGWAGIVALRDQPRFHGVPILVLGLAPAPEPRDPLLPPLSLRNAGLPAAGLHSLSGPLVLRSALRILLVEDDEDLARVLTAMFQQHHVEIVVARSGREAIDAAAFCRPDLVVLDVGLPEGDGFQVVRGLKGNEQLRQVPLVVYSGRQFNEQEREQLRLGPTEFMTKGQIAPDVFERHVLKLLQQMMA